MPAVIATTDPYGEPQCPWCHQSVKREGEFDTEECWTLFHRAIYEAGEIVEMSYLTLNEQPFYTVDQDV